MPLLHPARRIRNTVRLSSRYYFSGSIHFWFVMLRLHFLRAGTE